MHVGSLLEIYTTIYGWQLFNLMVDILSMTGLLYAPLIAIIYINIRQPATSQDNKAASLTSLSRMQWDMYTTILIILIAVAPILNLRLNTMKHQQICYDQSSGTHFADPEDTGGNTGSTYDQIPVTDVKIPLLWYLTLQVSSGINYTAVANLPCLSNITWLDENLRNMTIPDPVIRAEFNRFANECFLPAKNKFIASMNGGQFYDYTKDEWNVGSVSGSAYKADDPYYIGSRFYLETEGYYENATNPAQTGHGFRANKPVAGWPYDPVRDKDFNTDAINAGIGSPTCAEWWAQPGIGLRQKLADSAEAINDNDDPRSMFEKAKQTILSLLPTTTDDEIQDIVIRSLVAQNNPDFTGTGDQWKEANLKVEVGGHDIIQHIGGVGGDPKRLAAAAGILFSSGSISSHYSSMYFIKQAAPMAQALVLCVIYFLLPVLMVISRYEVKVIMIAVFAIMGLKFFSVLWALAEYLDDQLFIAMYPDVTLIGSLYTADFKRMILDMVLTGFYVIGPMILLFVFSFAGFHFAKLGGIASDTTKSVEGAGGAAGKGAVDAAGTLATKGVKAKMKTG